MNDAANQKRLMEDALANLKPRQLHRTLFNLADTYNQAAELSLGKISSTGNADFAAPAVLCRSFAVELLLKFFIVAAIPTAKDKASLDALGIDLRGHSYSALFDRIEASLQSAIARKYSERSGTTTNSDGFRSILIALGDSPFVEWRYVYEGTGVKHLDIALFAVVTDSLGLAAQDLTRKLSPAGMTGPGI